MTSIEQQFERNRLDNKFNETIRTFECSNLEITWRIADEVSIAYYYTGNMSKSIEYGLYSLYDTSTPEYEYARLRNNLQFALGTGNRYVVLLNSFITRDMNSFFGTVFNDRFHVKQYNDYNDAVSKISTSDDTLRNQFIAHVNLWRQLVNSDAKEYIIFDTVSSIHIDTDTFIEYMNADTEFIFYSYQEYERSTIKDRFIKKYAVKDDKRWVILTSCAYKIRRDMASKLLHDLDALPNTVDTTIDCFLQDVAEKYDDVCFLYPYAFQ